MRMGRWVTLAAAAQILVLAGCVPAVMGPTVQVTPGPAKSAEAFGGDLTACKTFAEQQVAPARDAANQQIVGNALLGGAFGATQTSAAGGSNSAVAVGGVAGAASVGMANAQAAQVVLQQQYDTAYSQCMYAKGNIVPGIAPAVVGSPVRHHRVRRLAPKNAAGNPAGQVFVEPAPAEPAGASGGFAEPPPASH